jgi:hypothetical protein
MRKPLITLPNQHESACSTPLPTRHESGDPVRGYAGGMFPDREVKTAPEARLLPEHNPSVWPPSEAVWLDRNCLPPA